MGEEVGDGIGGACDMFQSVVEVLEEFDPSSLSACDLLWFMEVLQVLVVC